MSNVETKRKQRNKVNVGLVIALVIVSALLITTSILWMTEKNMSNQMGVTIEGVYQKNFYDLVDNVNNAEVKLSKVMACSDDGYSRKLLDEISKNTSFASENLSNLPISINGIDETKKFINQVTGYTSSLCEKLDRGQSLTSAEKDTLYDIYLGMRDIKNNLAEFNKEYMMQGFNIFENGNLLDGDYNNFTVRIQGIKDGSVEYPTMIYDGPFAESLINKEIKGLSGDLVSVDYAKSVIKNTYEFLQDEDIKYKTETTGMFNTFDFEVKISENVTLYVQVTKTAGKILTISGYGDEKDRRYSLFDAISIAKNIANKQTGTTFDCVWSDIVGGDAYINLAPVQNGVVLYPDLIKAKIDLASGRLIGYTATNYFINHTQRSLPTATYDKSSAQSKIPQGYIVNMSRLCLAPLDYKSETLCYEFECTFEDSTYYIYINAQSGVTENILRVIETNDGNKLM